MAPSPAAVSAPAAYAPLPAPVSRNQGVVLAVREIRTPGEAQGLGAVAGGVLGGVIGNQIGKGTGRDAARIVGVVGGAVAGHQIEKQARASVRYEVDVRMDDGTQRTVALAQAPDLRAGDPVRVDAEGLRLADGRAVPVRAAPPTYGMANPYGGN